MDTFLLQDLLTISTGAAGGSITQSEAGWVDLAAYRDLVLWLDVRETSTSSLVIALQSAPAKEESLFATMATSAAVLSAGISVVPILQDLQTGAANAAPLSRWVRWQATLSGSSWNATFRIWLAANKPGRAAMTRK